MRDRRWIGGEISITLVLHTWGQHLGQHVHIHGLVTAGGLSGDRKSWRKAKRRFQIEIVSGRRRTVFLAHPYQETQEQGRSCHLDVAGSERGGGVTAIVYSLIETTKLNMVDPQVWLTDFLNPITDHKINRIGSCCRGIIFLMNNSTGAYRVFGPH